MSAISYVRGQFVPEAEATINIRTHAFLYGSSIFEGIRGYWNAETEAVYLFRMKEHFERILDSAKLIFIKTDLTVDKLIEITAELVRRNGFTSDIYVQPRLYKSGFVVPPRLEEVDSDYCCFAIPFGDYVSTEKGLSVCVSSWRRISDNAIPPRGKIGGAYVNSGLVMAEAHLNGFDDGIMLTEDGHVSEGSGMNLFLVRNGKLITSRTTDNILEGITRDSIIQLASNELGMPVEQRLINRTELYLADEAFLVGTATQVASVTSIDHRPIGTGEIGEFSRKLRELYIEVARGKHPKYAHWLTEVKAHALSH